MNSYTLELAKVTVDSHDAFGQFIHGYAAFGTADGPQFSMTRDQWVQLGRPVTLSIVVHAVYAQAEVE